MSQPCTVIVLPILNSGSKKGGGIGGVISVPALVTNIATISDIGGLKLA